jgi:hypothetical protein
VAVLSLVDALRQSATSLLKSQGQPITLTGTGGTYDVATRTFTGTGSPVSTVGIVLPLPRGLTHDPGTDIQDGDQQLLLPGSIAQPLVDATAVIGGKPYIIISVNVISPSGSPVYYDCIIRGPQ